ATASPTIRPKAKDSSVSGMVKTAAAHNRGPSESSINCSHWGTEQFLLAGRARAANAGGIARMRARVHYHAKNGEPSKTTRRMPSASDGRVAARSRLV